MAEGYRIIREGPGSFSVEGFFRRNGEQRFSAASGFKSEAEARQWVYNQQAKDREADSVPPGAAQEQV